MNRLAELIERVERLTGEPSSAEIEELIRLSPWYDYPSYDRVWTAFTRAMYGSLDAAIALTERVLPGWTYLLNNDSGCCADLFPPDWPHGQNFEAGHASSMPVAIVLATLKALAAREGAET